MSSLGILQNQSVIAEKTRNLGKTCFFLFWIQETKHFRHRFQKKKFYAIFSFCRSLVHLTPNVLAKGTIFPKILGFWKYEKNCFFSAFLLFWCKTCEAIFFNLLTPNVLARATFISFNQFRLLISALMNITFPDNRLWRYQALVLAKR